MVKELHKALELQLCKKNVILNYKIKKKIFIIVYIIWGHHLV